jgi:cobalt-zinc-cadmium efflux system outer membrane protein
LADSLLAHLGAHPEQLAAAAAVAVEEARLREARSARVPDLAVEGGLKRLQETGSVGMVAGLTLSLPIWNPGGGAVSAAAAEKDAALASQEAARASLSAEVERASARLTGALGSLAALRQDVTPRSRVALLQIENGYRAGRFSYLDLADAQRSLLEAETATITAATEAWRARAELSRISGGQFLQPGEGGSK